MATLLTTDEKVRIILDTYKRMGRKAGDTLSAGNFISAAINNRISNQDIVDGLRAGYDRGLFEDGPRGSVLLTEAGYAAFLSISGT